VRRPTRERPTCKSSRELGEVLGPIVDDPRSTARARELGGLESTARWWVHTNGLVSGHRGAVPGLSGRRSLAEQLERGAEQQA
jgi:hypothetical protein